jgi:hypothetical protein
MRSSSRWRAAAVALLGVHPPEIVMPPGTFTSTPTVAEVAAPLAELVPAPARAEALRLLVDEVLPWELRALAPHPRPAALAQAVLDGLRAPLELAAPERRLPLLAERALHGRVQRAHAEAVDLALRRYALEHPARAGDAIALLGDPAIAGLSREATVERAAALGARLDALEREARPSATALETDRLTLLHARLAAASARSGSFAVAAGPFADLLRQLGERPRVLDVH